MTEYTLREFPPFSMHHSGESTSYQDRLFLSWPAFPAHISWMFFVDTARIDNCGIAGILPMSACLSGGQKEGNDGRG